MRSLIRRLTGVTGALLAAATLGLPRVGLVMDAPADSEAGAQLASFRMVTLPTVMGRLTR